MALAPAVAFQRTLSEVPASWERSRGLGVTPDGAGVLPRPRAGHLLEYLAMLDDPPRPHAGIVSFSEWSGSG